MGRFQDWCLNISGTLRISRRVFACHGGINAYSWVMCVNSVLTDLGIRCQAWRVGYRFSCLSVDSNESDKSGSSEV